MGGEPSLAVDLADTLVTITDPPTDLIADPDQYQRWWQLQASRLPCGRPNYTSPTSPPPRRLRHAIREAFDAHLASTAPLPTSVDDINAAAAAAPTSARLETAATTHCAAAPAGTLNTADTLPWQQSPTTPSPCSPTTNCAANCDAAPTPHAPCCS